VKTVAAFSLGLCLWLVGPPAQASDVAAPVATPQAGSEAGLHLDVLLVNDPDFPPVPSAPAMSFSATSTPSCNSGCSSRSSRPRWWPATP